MISENLSTLKIHKLTKEQYERELAAGRVDPTAIYLTPDASEEIDLDNVLVVDKTGAEANNGYLKLQNPLKSGEDNVYPLTTYDQIILDDGSRFDGGLTVDLDETVLGEAPLTDADLLGGQPAFYYLPAAATATNSNALGGLTAEHYALKTDISSDASSLGGIAADQYALKTDSAPDANKLGGKDPKYYIQPRNLLDNSDFINPVNQRGSTSYAATGAERYTIDRWIGLKNTAVHLNNGYIELAPQATSGRGFKQIISNPSRYAGKTLTIAANIVSVTTGAGLFISDGTAKGVTITAPGVYTYTKTISSDVSELFVQISLSGSTDTERVVVEWIALYEGTYTVGNLPPYIPKGYGVELAECQRYFLTGVGSHIQGHGGVIADKEFYLTVPTPVTMRITPTVTIDTADNIVFGTTSGYAVVGVESIKLVQKKNNGIFIILNLGSGQPQQYAVGSTYGISMSFSAEDL